MLLQSLLRSVAFGHDGCICDVFQASFEVAALGFLPKVKTIWHQIRRLFLTQLQVEGTQSFPYLWITVIIEE